MSTWENPDTPIYIRGYRDALQKARADVAILATRKANAGSTAKAAGRDNVAEHRIEEARVLLDEVLPLLRFDLES